MDFWLWDKHSNHALRTLVEFCKVVSKQTLFSIGRHPIS
ncbi:hypothetical protein MTR67_052241 [Solanum verrucosum]|uniref:Uncharacterized protein n=1 Tax=Solanum verrucosum TaxID=315347 RepID=A0AAF0V8Z3_SOLVR|nr:hypothetical protein MTR67_052241 [Solanum verrucosum]